MGHYKVFGYCENLCNVEVQPKKITENLYNENMLMAGDFLVYPNADKPLNCWDIEGFEFIDANGMLIRPNTTGYIQQSLFASWFGFSQTDYFPIILTVETRLNQSGASNVVHSVVIENASALNNDGVTVFEIESGKYLKCKLEGGNNDYMLRIYPSDKLSNQFFIRRVKLEHGNYFTGWASSYKDTLIHDMIYKMSYHKGDEISLYRETYAGHLTGSRKNLYFYIPLNKPIDDNIADEDCATLSGPFVIRHSDGRAVSTTNAYVLNGGELSSLGTVKTYKTSNGIMVMITCPDELDFTNNCPITVYGTKSANATSKLTFN